jgi:predicted flap endonuclease-1-like 5' DNA nuclease
MITCWGIAAFAGLVAMVMLFWMAEFSALQAIFTGGLIGTALGAVLGFTVCGTQTSATDLASGDKPAKLYAAQAAERKAAETSTDMADKAAAAVAQPAGVPAGSAGTSAGSAGATPGTAEAASGVSASATNRTATVGGPEAGTVAEGATDMSAPTGTTAGVSTASAAAPPAKAINVEPVAVEPVAKKPAAKAAAKPKASASTAGGDAKPELLLTAARPEGKDDLKLIGGVGPKLEQTLNDLGVYHFDQVAKFKKKDIAWVDERLRFKGRIERDDWMSQAKILAKGGETEFSKGKKKN